jgi:hypothetical protein
MNHNNSFRQFTHIKGLSDRRRLPRLGKIRLGIKTISQGGKDIPKEVDYFVCPEEVRKIYGLCPAELEVMFPLDDIEIIFPQRYEAYSSSRGLRCVGDGEVGSRVNEKDQNSRIETKCPCEFLGKGCNRRGHLFFIIPRVSFGGVYQLDVGSYRSIINLNSGLDYVRGLLGRFAFVPLKLKREPEEVHHNGVKAIHYPVKVLFEGDIDRFRSLRSRGPFLPEHIEPGPEVRNPDPTGDDLPSSGEE